MTACCVRGLVQAHGIRKAGITSQGPLLKPIAIQDSLSSFITWTNVPGRNSGYNVKSSVPMYP